ncbi:MFS transporter [Streptomyces sp. NPDC054796]
MTPNGGQPGAGRRGGGIRAALGPLRRGPYRYFWSGQVLSQLGSAVSTVSLPFAVLQIGGGSGGLGLVLAARMLPQPLLALLGGTVTDRTSARHVMVTAHLVSGLAQAAAAVLLLTGSARVWQLAGLALLTGASAAFFASGEQAVIPRLVDAAQRQRATALLRLAQNGCKTLGPALGGLLTAAAGPGWVTACDALSFLGAALLLSRIGLPLPLPAARRRSTVLADMGEGWREFRSRRWLWALTLQNAVTLTVWLAGFQVLGPLYAAQTLGGARPWGLAVTALAVGLAAGATAAMLWRPAATGVLICLGTGTMALPFLAMASESGLPVLMASMVVAGAGMDLAMVNWTCFVQDHVPVQRLGRVMSLCGTGPLLLVPVGYALVGPAAHLFTLRGTLALSATAIVLCSAAPLASRQILRLSRPTPGAPSAGTASVRASAPPP